MKFHVEHRYQGYGNLTQGHGILSLAAMVTASTMHVASDRFCVTDNMMGIQTVEGDFEDGVPTGDVTIMLHSGQQIEVNGVISVVIYRL